MMWSLAVLLSLAAFSMADFISPPILTMGTPSNTTICGSVVETWDWTGSNLGTTISVTNVVPENEISTSMPVPPTPYTDVIGVNIDLMARSFIWQQAAVPRGWYAFQIFDQAVGGTVSALSRSFFVEGLGTPTCSLVVTTGTVGRGPTSDGFPTATPVPVPVPGGGTTTPANGNTDSQSGGGINAGVIAGIVLGALAGIAIAGVLFFFLCRRRGRGFIRASRAFGKIDAEAKGGATKSGHGRWGGLGSVDVTTAANQAKPSPAGSDETAHKDFPFSSSTANGGSTAAQSRITLGDEKTDNDDENPFKEPVVPSLRSQHSGTFVQEEPRATSPVSRTTSPRPAPPPPPARRGSILSSSSSSQDHNAPPSSPPLTAQRRVSVGAKGPPPPITPRANRSGTGPKTPPAMSPRSRTASLKEFVDQNQGYAMAAYSLTNTSGQDEQARYSRHSNMPALAHAVPTAIITTPPRPPSTIGLPLTQPRRKPAPVYDIEMKSKFEGESNMNLGANGLGLSIGTSGGINASSATLGNGNSATALGSGTGIGLAADGDGPVHYLIPDLPPPQPRGR